MHNNTRFGAYLYSVDTHHGNLHKPLATMSKVFLFILNDGERARNGEIRKEKKFLALCKACVGLFRPTPGFKWRTFVALSSQ